MPASSINTAPRHFDRMHTVAGVVLVTSSLFLTFRILTDTSPNKIRSEAHHVENTLSLTNEQPLSNLEMNEATGIF